METSSTQKPSQALVQQSVFFAQTQLSTLASEHPGPGLSEQQLPLQVPQPSAPTSATQASFQPFVQQYWLPVIPHTHFSTAGSLQPLPAWAVQHAPLGPTAVPGAASSPASATIVVLPPAAELAPAVPADPDEAGVPPEPFVPPEPLEASPPAFALAPAEPLEPAPPVVSIVAPD